MTDKSTPGPWVVDEDHKGMGEVRVYEGDLIKHGGRLVAVFGNAENDHERKMADAHLGAAAPELYKALKRALDELDCAADQLQRMGNPSHAEDIRITIDACGDVLAKARGEK